MHHVTQSPAMPPSEAIFRQLKNAAAVLSMGGLSHADVNAAMRESFALFYAHRALESGEPRAELERMIEALTRQLDNNGLSAAVRLPVQSLWARLCRRAA